MHEDAVPQAKAFIGSLEGSGAKAQIILFDNGITYVVKFKGNPQGKRVLANELVAARLAERVGLPVTETAVVRVCQEFIDFEPQLYKHPFVGGLQFGSRYYDGAFSSPTLRILEKIDDPALFAGIIVFDQWLNNWDRSNHGDNVLYLPLESFRLLLIDHGHAFGGPDWETDVLLEKALPMRPYFGLFYRLLGEFLMGNPFEPCLQRIEALKVREIQDTMQGMPAEWQFQREERMALLQFLLLRRKHLRTTIDLLKKERFPHCY